MATSRAVAEAEEFTPEPKRTFEWTGPNGQKLILAIPQRIKRGKVARRLSQNDMIGALDVIFTPEEVEAFEDLDLSPEEWDDIQNQLWEAVAGTGPKNS
ncbi:hypothetical protein [Nonomuraea sp. NPDC049480]|uniref:hypothetical protein n=1 Tax=Nonomuraea sp. NPDC049480 TaxID=3364353 RepID=UPI0037BB0CBE